MVASDHKQFVLVVEDHAERRPLRFHDREVSSVGVEDLNAFDVADVNAAQPIDGNRKWRAKLTRLIAGAAKTIHKLSIAGELEDAVVESSERVDVTRSVNCHPHTQL